MPQVISGVDVSLQVEEGSAPQARFGRGLCLSNIAVVLSAEDDIRLHLNPRRYNNAAAVRDAGESAAVQQAANVWFSGTIEPQAFVVGTQFGAAQPINIFGDEFAVATAAALGDNYTINFGARSVSANFDGLTTAAAIATALQTALNTHTDVSNATVEVVGTNSLRVTLPASLTGSVEFDATAEALGLGPDSNVRYYSAIEDAETAVDALTRIVAVNGDFTYIHLPTDAYNDITGVETENERIASIAEWAEANDRIFNFAAYGGDVLVANETSSPAALQFSLERNNVAGDYTGPDSPGLLPVGIQTVMSAVRFRQAGTARNVANRIIPGVTPHIISIDAAEELDRKRLNYYRQEGQLRHVRGGRTFREWYEVSVFLLWLKNDIGLAAYNYQQRLEAFTATDADYAGLRAAISVPLDQSVSSGFLVPGRVSDSVRNQIRSVTGNRGFDGILGDGYLVWNAPAVTATAAQLSGRESLPVYFWAKGAPMINEINIQGNYAR